MPAPERRFAKLRSICAEPSAQPPARCPRVTPDAGVKFARASKEDPSAWSVAIDLIDYRSYLNTFSTVLPPTVPVDRLTTIYHLAESPPPGRNSPQFTIPSAAVHKDAAAICEPLGLPPADADNPLGNPFIIGTGGYLDLDGMHLRHVFLNGVEIHYSGKPLMMEDVVFLNCTFIMENIGPTRQLAQAIAADTNIKFTYS